MAAGSTYSPSLPSDKDWVRLKIGDTDAPDGTVYSDAEIEAMLSIGSNKWIAAADLAESLVASDSGGAVEKAVDGLRLRWSDSPKSAYRALIDELRAEGARQLLGSQDAFITLGDTC